MRRIGPGGKSADPLSYEVIGTDIKGAREWKTEARIVLGQWRMDYARGGRMAA